MSVLTAVAPPETVVAQTTAELQRWHVPALELVVVRDGEVLYADALGDGVSSRTLFHHGSCGKAYTGLLAALLAEKGILDLDEPVRRWVPELVLPDPVVAERMTVRDLLSHRAGLGRHDLAWILNSSWTREEAVARMAHLPLTGDLRAQWQYSNFGFTLAGFAIGRATSSSWEEQVQSRVLGPLGMTRTTTSVREAQADADCAAPHLLRGDEAVLTPFRILDAVAPAGQLISCAEDSVQWLLAQLGDDRVSASAVKAAQHPQMLLPAGVAPFEELQFLGYGMGWVVGSYRGRRLVWHNGGVDGFSTQTLLLPEQQIGIVASANLHSTNFPLAVVLQLADALLTVEPVDQDWFDRLRPAPAEVPEQQAPSTALASPAHPLDDYAGDYRHPGYGDLAVTVDSDALAVRIGEFSVDAKHRHFETWDLCYEALDADFPSTFLTNADGEVAAVLVDLPDAQMRFERRAVS
jgi:CubicO group peptidase (beta-lactamase class C family)